MPEINMTKEFAAKLKENPANYMTKQEAMNHDAANRLDVVSRQIRIGNLNVSSFHCEKLQDNFRNNPNGSIVFVRFNFSEKAWNSMIEPTEE